MFGKYVCYIGLAQVHVNKVQVMSHLHALANFRWPWTSVGRDEALKMPLSFFVLMVPLSRGISDGMWGAGLEPPTHCFRE